MGMSMIVGPPGLRRLTQCFIVEVWPAKRTSVEQRVMWSNPSRARRVSFFDLCYGIEGGDVVLEPVDWGAGNREGFLLGFGQHSRGKIDGYHFTCGPDGSWLRQVGV